MRLSLFCFLMILLVATGTKCHSQEPVNIMLSADLFDANLYFPHKLKISSNQTITISGVIMATETVIIPTESNAIIIVPSSISENYLARSGTGEGGGGTTVIGSKGTTTGRPFESVRVFPNPVQVALNFHLPDNLAIALSVFDMNSILKVTSSFLPSNNGAVDVSSLQPGLYILKIDLITGGYNTVQFIKN